MTKIRVLVLATALTVLAGCAAGNGDPAAAPPRGEESVSALPTQSVPTAPPSEPTDYIQADHDLSSARSTGAARGPVTA